MRTATLGLLLVFLALLLLTGCKGSSGSSPRQIWESTETKVKAKAKKRCTVDYSGTYVKRITRRPPYLYEIDYDGQKYIVNSDGGIIKK